MGRGRRGVYKAEKRRKEIKRQAKQDAKRKRRLATDGEHGVDVSEGADNALGGESVSPGGPDEPGPGDQEAVEDT